MCAVVFRDRTFGFKPRKFDFELLEKRQAAVSVWLADTEQSNTHWDTDSLPNYWKQWDCSQQCKCGRVAVILSNCWWCRGWGVGGRSISQLNLNSRHSAHISATLQLLKLLKRNSLRFIWIRPFLQKRLVLIVLNIELEGFTHIKEKTKWNHCCKV